ncbi:MAG: hypothetical protein CO158_00570 [Piscirickettsiaceae bacterium CG_4_9_14_3_um_filter_43_564]|nr:DUF302 domain-containing protein [Thiomicrospira sp.]OIP95341.1 MAG: hypothetical protein AUK56_05915 [Thiomicrospira sp. CG2_30_44_34]PIU38977.1 MAG: hypothetical protein COT01_04220 [Piscirickettsiaceae bacterium CG07_land_8_20_14_0_80_44_28]PIW78280.1 MAG: hypothetical protein CO000_02085 [Piscirickettsiaceae bacterium CG_4_8_14_3_um_filter_44_38]PIY75556.1 MAG: hypothetical protein COY84_10695 [Piscirickettsiaceae bacterium CG_4_10_14_0_8_um_filter_44_742]PIZ73304.1 MAG: hypothetical pr
MKYVVTTDKDVDTVCSEMETVVPAHQFGIVAVHDLQETMQKKGVEFDKAVKVFEICNPKKAKAVLEKDMDLAIALPCRIAVYEDNGQTKISMMAPAAMLKALNPDPELEVIALAVESSFKAMMDQLK